MIRDTENQFNICNNMDQPHTAALLAAHFWQVPTASSGGDAREMQYASPAIYPVCANQGIPNHGRYVLEHECKSNGPWSFSSLASSSASVSALTGAAIDCRLPHYFFFSDPFSSISDSGSDFFSDLVENTIPYRLDCGRQGTGSQLLDRSLHHRCRTSRYHSLGHVDLSRPTSPRRAATPIERFIPGVADPNT